jgi:hypothetical protein
MNKTAIFFIIISLLSGCKSRDNIVERKPIAEVGKNILYYDEIPQTIKNGVDAKDSTSLIQNYINKWAKKELLLQKAVDNLSPETQVEINNQLEETKENLVIYQYQRQMMLEKMDTVISESEIESYFANNEQHFILNSNIIKALLIKLPVETPNMEKIKVLARSNSQNDLQQLESICFQFADKFDDFNEEWVPMDRILAEINEVIENEDNFLKRNTFIEKEDSGFIYLISIRDYRLKSSVAPFDYVKDDIKRILWNSRRIEFIQNLENGIYNEGLKTNSIKIY